MNLKAYLDSTMKPNETKQARYTRFADKLGVTLHAVRKWLQGERRIHDHHKVKIESMTGGAVSVRDLAKRQ